MLIIPARVFQYDYPRNLHFFEVEDESEEQDADDREPYQAIKRKSDQKRRKIKPPLRYQTVWATYTPLLYEKKNSKKIFIEMFWDRFDFFL